MTRIEFHTKAHNYLCLLIAFFLPVYIHVVPVMITLLTINWVAEGKFVEKFSFLRKNKIAWVFIGFYLLHVLGMLWTENRSAGWFDLQVKLSLLIFPLIFVSKQSEMKRTLFAFVSGCVVSGIICLAIALIHFLRTGENHFTYTNFSFLLHPSYFAMYLNFAIAVLLFSFKRDSTIKEISIKLFGVIFLSVIIILLGAKSGIAILAIVILLFAFFQVIAHKNWILGASTVITIFFMIISANKFVPSTVDRFQSLIYPLMHMENINPKDTASMESSTERILIWKSAVQTIKNNFPAGAGTGDVKDELLSTYKINGYNYLYKHNLNAHSQFLQSTIALGIAGTLFLIFPILMELISAMRKKQFIIIAFLLIIFINFLVESMLETQAGVIFYLFFFFLLISQRET